MSEESAWEELQQAAAAATPTSKPAPAWKTSLAKAKAWWREAAWWKRGAAALMAFAVLGVVTVAVVGVVGVVGKALFPQDHPVVAAAPTLAPTETPTPTPKPTPTATPTPQPQLVVWSPAGGCAYVRPDAGIDNEPLTCIANGTAVVDLGERQEANGFTWARVQSPTNQGYAAIGWMAVGAVAWNFQASRITGDEKIPLYEEDYASVQMYLPPHTPLVIVQDSGDGWLRVLLPDQTAGYIEAQDLEK